MFQHKSLWVSDDLFKIAVDPGELLCALVRGCGHDLCGAHLKEGTLDIIVASDVQAIRKAAFCLRTIPQLVDLVNRGIHAPIAYAWRKILLCVTGPNGLHRNVKLCLIHMVNQIAQHPLRSASGQRFNEKKDLNQATHLFRRYDRFSSTHFLCQDRAV